MVMTWVLFAAWLVVAATLVFGWTRIERWRYPVLGGVLALSLIHQLMFATLAEDAFISFRYSANLAEGHGLVFNVGEKVEGYSNFLWVVLVAAPHAAFGADIVTTARVLGVACALGCVLAVYALTRRLTNSARAGLLAATIVAAVSSLAAYGPSGLETPLFALLALLVMLAVQANRPLLAGLLVALATMTRPDGVVIAVVVGVWLVAKAVRERTWRAPVWYVAGAVVLAASWTVWRVAYYGHLVPNAIAAKSGASLTWLLHSGFDYLSGYLVAAQALLVLVPVGIFALFKSRSAGVPALLITLAAVYVGFFVVTGGDWMPGWRFFAPAMPLLAAGCVAAAAGAWPVATRAAPVLAASVAVLMLVSSVWYPSYKREIDVWHNQVNELGDIGTWVGATVPPGTTIATFANGSLSYAAGSRVTVVDLLGLTDEHIARDGKRDSSMMIGHQANDYAYVLGTRAPSIVFTSGSGFALTPACAVGPRYSDRYRGAVFRVRDFDRWLIVLYRKDVAERLARRMDGRGGFELQRWCDQEAPTS